MLVSASIAEFMNIESREQVMFYDTDCGGVVSNIAYLRFVEKARTALFEELGMSPGTMTETQVFPAVIRTEIDYLYPARLGDQIRIEAHLESVEKVRVFCRFRLVIEGEQERVSAEVVQTVALVQLPSGRPKGFPLSGLNTLEKPVFSACCPWLNNSQCKYTN